MAIKNGDKKVTAKTQAHYDTILCFMEDGKEYKASDFEDLINAKASRLRIILGELVDTGMIEAVGERGNRRYIKLEG